jgi:hypothetical protein
MPSREELLFLATLLNHSEVLGIGEVVHLHAERQPHVGQDVLDLVQRLAAEVLVLSISASGVVPARDQADVGVLKTVNYAPSSSSSTLR